MILYFGNILSSSGNSPSFIEFLGPKLRKRYSVEMASDKRSKPLRLMDMVWTFLKRYRHACVILIDTYSTYGFYYVVVLAFLCRLFSIPYIPILRGGDLSQRLKNNPRLCQFVFMQAELLVAPSAYMMKIFKDYGYHNVIIIANSIELEDYKFNPRRSIKPSLLWVRSFHKIYNPLMAVDVLKMLIKSYPNVCLCMVGPDKDGSLQACKDYVRESGLEDRVLFPGILSKSDWHKLSSSYDIFINTTNTDNAPVSVIEAMALGLPVVSTNVGGVPFLISDQETGLLVNSGDTKAMADRIQWLIENPSAAYHLSLQARSCIEEFDYEIIKEKWFTLLDKFEKPSST